MNTGQPFGDSWRGLRFLAINLWCCRSITGATARIAEAPEASDPVLLRGLARGDIDQFEQLHRKLRPGKPFSKWRRWLYLRAGSKLVWVMQTASGQLAGFNMYYFREGEWRQEVVHEAFIGILEEFRGSGMSTNMRLAAATHFGDAGLQGISTQIDRANEPSLRSARNVGFQRTGFTPGGLITLLLPLPPFCGDRYPAKHDPGR